jgi:HAD superfamily hydrolase (TIGR01549 family)
MPAAETNGHEGMDLRAIFFDAGFTLVTAGVSLAETISNVASGQGLSISGPQIEAIMPSTGVWMAAALRADPDLFAHDDRLRLYWRDYYLSIFDTLGIQGDTIGHANDIYTLFNSPGAWELYPDVIPALKRLKAEGYVMGIISDWGSSLTANILLPLGIGPYMDFMVVSANVREAKPSSGIFREALARAGVAPRQAVHIGDSYVHDVLGARSAGVAGILIERHHMKTAPLDCPKISSLEELPALLESLKHGATP